LFFIDLILPKVLASTAGYTKVVDKNGWLRWLKAVRTYFVKQLLTPIPATEYDISVLVSCFENRPSPQNFAQI